MKKLMLLAVMICLAIAVNAQSNGIIPEGTVLVKNHHYFSPNGKFSLCYQTDGNLVVYKHLRLKNIVPLWNSGRYFSGRCIFQKDGNLVIYYDNGKAVWNAMDKWKKAGPGREVFIHTAFRHELRVQDDGNVVIYLTKNGVETNDAIYHTNTAGR